MLPEWAKMKPVNSVTANNTGGMMITQEMVLAAKNAENNVSALVAVYPMILEQAARVCDKFHGTWAVSETCSREIRNLKDKTDEAHNG